MGYGKKIEEARGRKGWSQTELAKEIGMDQSAVSRCERDKQIPTAEQFVAISEKTGMSLDELMKGKKAEVVPEPELSEAQLMAIQMVKTYELTKEQVMLRLPFDPGSPRPGGRFSGKTK